LDLDEFEERVGHVTRARTNADLGAVLVDLPAVGPPTPEPPAPWTSAPSHTPSADAWAPHHARGRHGPLPSWVKLSLIMVAIWAMAGFGYFWPVWIIVPFALASLGGCGRNRYSRHDHRRVSA
jgi:hypothetical protein